MPFPAYPDAAEVESLMRSANYWPDDSLTAKVELARRQAYLGALAAVGEWERLTGWKPFLSPGTPQTRYFESSDEGGCLDLRAGLLSLTSVVIGDVTQTIGPQCRPMPRNAQVEGDAYTGIQFGGGGAWGFGSWGRHGFGDTSEIAVTGIWGRVDVIPDDVYQTILQKAALTVLQQTENTQSIGSISQDGFVKSFDITGILTQQNLVQQWGKDFPVIASRWKRVIT